MPSRAPASRRVVSQHPKFGIRRQPSQQGRTGGASSILLLLTKAGLNHVQLRNQVPHACEVHATSSVSMAKMTPEKLHELIGLVWPAVLLPVPDKTKKPIIPGWPDKTLAAMGDQSYLASLCGGNVGVLLGQNSDGLCTIDLDDDQFATEFLAANPRLAKTLRTRGLRGCNIWVRIEGSYPATKHLRHRLLLDSNQKARRVGEWRATGSQTILCGTHPEKVDYQFVVWAKPIEIRFEEINWPADWTSPGGEPSRSRVSVPDADTTAAGGQPSVGLPQVILPSGGVGINETAEQLFPLIASSTTIFSRERAMVEVVMSGDGRRRLEVITGQMFRSRMEFFASLYAWRKTKGEIAVLAPTVASLDHANALMATVAAHTLLPKIVGLVNCPVLLLDGDECRIVGAGYDARSAIFVTGGELPPVVALQEAVAALKGLIYDYRFQSPGDRSRALASLITPALRFGGHITGYIPIDATEADLSQAGKGYREQLKAAIYNELPTLVTQKQGGVGSDDETLNGALLAGRPFIVLDNRRGRFNSTHLEALLTAPGPFLVRVPYRPTLFVNPSWFVFGLTSNGVELTEDLANRASIVRIKKQPPGYQFVEHPEGDVLAHVRGNQPYYLGCVFSVILAWLQADKPRTKESRHSFRDWCQPVDWIVRHLLDEAPVMDGHASAQERVANAGLTFLRRLAFAVAKTGRLGQPLAATELYEVALAEAVDIPSLHKPDDSAGPRLVGKSLAQAFGGADEIEAEGFRVMRLTTKVPREEGGSFDSKRYTFSHAIQEPGGTEGLSSNRSKALKHSDGSTQDPGKV